MVHFPRSHPESLNRVANMPCIFVVYTQDAIVESQGHRHPGMGKKTIRLLLGGGYTQHIYIYIYIDIQT